MDSDLANILLIFALMGVGVVAFLATIAVYLIVTEFLQTWYLED